MTEREIFLAALKQPTAGERAAFLDQACGSDVSLRGQIEALLAEHERLGSYLEAPVAAAQGTVDNPPVSERPGTVIGPYKLLQQIGEGGMGTVYMAEQQQPIRRKVAVKVLKPGMDTRQVIARFEAERQALALMDHPNIARVLDAGDTPTGRPYFVMELVKAVPITDYCDQNSLTPRERLELFLPVCQAVQHAHQKGIIHRDIKPSNALVTLHDGMPVVKVIDFGIAKALGQQLTDKTLFTNFAQMIGTPLYMSPEQAALSGLDVDTRSDIYSLGVLLYELLTGSTPFDKERFTEVGYDEMRRIIREEEPPKPSTRISTLGQGSSTASARRRSDPKRLSQLFRGELDWIVMKALEKDRNRRYETASALAADIERYLRDEPVQACPPSRRYRLRKFARRYRAPLVTACAFVLVLVVGVVCSSWLAIRATQAEARANRQRDEAEANFRKACQAVDEQFTLVSQSTLFDAPGLQYLRKDLLESALKYYQEFLRQRPGDPELQADVAVAYFRLYEIYQVVDSCMSADAVLALEKGVAVVEKLLPEHRPEAELYRRLAGFRRGSRFLHSVVSPRGPRADPRVALPLFERAARIWEDFVRYNPAEIGFQIDLAAFYFASHVMQADEGRPAEALANVRKTYAIREKIARENPNVPEYRSELAWAHDFLADGLGQVGRAEEVEKHCRQSLELRKQLVEECPRVGEYRGALAVSHHNLGDCLRNTGQLPEAEQAYRQALILREKLVIEFPFYPACRGDLADGQYTLGHLLRLTGRLEKAAEAYRQALALWEKLAADFPSIADYREKVVHSSYYACLVLAATGRPQEAEQFYRKVVEFKPESPDAYSGLAWMLVSHPDSRFRDPSRAVEMAKKAVELGAHRKELWDYCNNLGIAHYRAGNWKDAIAAVEKSMVLANGQDESANTFFLAMAHWRLGDKEQARKWYGRAVQWMEKNQLPREELRQELLRFRAEATKLLGIKDQPTAKEKEKPQQGPKA